VNAQRCAQAILSSWCNRQIHCIRTSKSISRHLADVRGRRVTFAPLKPEFSGLLRCFFVWMFWKLWNYATWLAGYPLLVTLASQTSYRQVALLNRSLKQTKHCYASNILQVYLTLWPQVNNTKGVFFLKQYQCIMNKWISKCDVSTLSSEYKVTSATVSTVLCLSQGVIYIYIVLHNFLCILVFKFILQAVSLNQIKWLQRWSTDLHPS
jgi:hypothetical protein